MTPRSSCPGGESTPLQGANLRLNYEINNVTDTALGNLARGKPSFCRSDRCLSYRPPGSLLESRGGSILARAEGKPLTIRSGWNSEPDTAPPAAAPAQWKRTPRIGTLAPNGPPPPGDLPTLPTVVGRVLRSRRASNPGLNTTEPVRGLRHTNLSVRSVMA